MKINLLNSILLLELPNKKNIMLVLMFKLIKLKVNKLSWVDSKNLIKYLMKTLIKNVKSLEMLLKKPKKKLLKRKK